MSNTTNTAGFKNVFATLANTSKTVAGSGTKRYTVAGLSTLPNGETKVRLANNLKDRVGILRRNGHVNIMLLQLSVAMTEAEATQYLLTVDFGSDEFNNVVAAHAAKLGVSRKVEEVEEVEEEDADMTDEEAAFAELGKHN